MIEMLVALAATMLMMGAVVTLFGVMSESVSGSRSLLEISDRLRACRNRLQADLQGATATMKPPLRPENDEGYLEIVEGEKFDGRSDIPTAAAPNSLFGDTDDALLLTVRSRGEPFIGKFNNTTIESQVAEVAYFLAWSDTEPIIDANTSPPLRLFTLYRRVMLVVPSTGLVLPPTVGLDFFNTHDVSARYETTTASRVANTLGDLTKPENRFNRIPPGTAFPFRFDRNIVGFTGVRLGDDIIMTNVLAFDVQVYDPGAPVFVSANGMAVEPRDQGYTGLISNNPASLGAYVDIGYTLTGYPPPAGGPAPSFDGVPDSKSSVAVPTRPYSYDTWSLHYENNGIDEGGVPPADAGTNGLDDGGAPGIVDDLGEYDTLPPYSAPLRAIRVTIRVYEPSSRQVRQVTVVQDFLPE